MKSIVSLLVGIIWLTVQLKYKYVNMSIIRIV